MIEPFHQLCYESENKAVCWQGIEFSDCESFHAFLSTDVAARLEDQQLSAEFESHLQGLVGTGFSREFLESLLEAEQKEERDWAVGEALAESWLEKEHQVIWPWNIERDKRTPKASLPGADLVGFQKTGEEIRLVFGEVKSSSEQKHPPQVVTSKNGLRHQLEKLSSNLTIIYQLMKWLFVRCKNTKYENHYLTASRLFIQSGLQAVTLFGVLIRDTEVNKKDLENCGKTLGDVVQPQCNCRLAALYLPLNLSELPKHIHGGGSA